MKSRFTPDEIKHIVHTSRDTGVALAARQHGISEQTIYNWRKRLGITDVSQRIGELRRLRLENARLKRLVAERDLDIDLMKERVASRAPSDREQWETQPETPWSEASRGTALAGAYEEQGAGDKP